MKKYDKLIERLKEMKSVIVAFSGGVDSTLLLKACVDADIEVKAVTINAAFHTESEINDAKRLAEIIGAKHEILEINQFPEGTETNPIDRCYICKKSIFTLLKQKCQNDGYNYLVEGSNVDDLKDYRPGKKAIEELNVSSPLLDSGLTKSEIRLISKQLGLDTFDKPAISCLLTRFPYSTKITKELIKRVETGESFLRNIGIKQFRLRAHENGTLARIEIEKYELSNYLSVEELLKINNGLKELGFDFVSIDTEGYVMGKMNIGVK